MGCSSTSEVDESKKNQNFDMEKDIEALHEAVEKVNTDEAAIIRVVAKRPNSYRQELRKRYTASYGEDLVEKLKEETGGKLEEVLVALFYPPAEYACITLNQSMKGAGTDEDTLIEVIATKMNSDLKAIIDKYKELYDKDLIEQVKSETSDDFQKILVSVLQCVRSENRNPNEDECKKKAQELFDAGEGQWGTDESTFNKIFATSSPWELACINRHYKTLSNKSMAEVIESEFSGDIQKTLKTIFQVLTYPAEYFADRLNFAVKGAGTKEKILMRVIITRDEIDMPAIKKVYQEKYGETLIDAIKGDTSGDFKNILVALAED